MPKGGRYIEMVIVVDNKEVCFLFVYFLSGPFLKLCPLKHYFIYLFQYKKYGSMKSIETRMLEVANHVNKVLYHVTFVVLGPAKI